jgi:hypothetical protein
VSANSSGQGEVTSALDLAHIRRDLARDQPDLSAERNRLADVDDTTSKRYDAGQQRGRDGWWSGTRVPGSAIDRAGDHSE